MAIRVIPENTPPQRKLPAIREFHHDGKAYLRRESDGYFNATLMCQNNDLEWSAYRRSPTTQAFLDELERSMQNLQGPMIDQIATGPNHLRATWVHPRVAVDLAQWISVELKVAVNGWVTEKLLGRDAKLAALRRASIDKRNEYSRAALDHGCKSEHMGIITNKGYIGYKQMTAKQWKRELGLPEKVNLRDKLPAPDIAAIYLYEDIAAANIQSQNLWGPEECGDETHSAASSLRRFIQAQKAPAIKKS